MNSRRVIDWGAVWRAVGAVLLAAALGLGLATLAGCTLHVHLGGSYYGSAPPRDAGGFVLDIGGPARDTGVAHDTPDTPDADGGGERDEVAGRQEDADRQPAAGPAGGGLQFGPAD